MKYIGVNEMWSPAHISLVICGESSTRLQMRHNHFKLIQVHNFHLPKNATQIQTGKDYRQNMEREMARIG